MTFKKLSEYFKLLEQNTSRLKITEILAALFKESKEEEIDKICYLSLGRLLPGYEGVEFQMAGKMMGRTVAKAMGVEVGKVNKEYKKVGDLGEVGEELKVQSSKFKVQSLLGNLRGKKEGNLGVLRVYERLMEVAKESGPGSVERKVSKMAVLLEDLDALSCRFIIRMPLGKMRLGFSEMTILDALSWMLIGNKSLRAELEDAYNVVADIGEIARKVRGIGEIRGIGPAFAPPIRRASAGKEIGEIKPKLGTPIVPALCQRLGTAEEIVEKLGEMAVEPKYDGTRLQLHMGDLRKVGGMGGMGNMGVRIFTRNLENVTHMFPDIAEAVEKDVLAREVIFDGEGVGIDPKTKEYLPFQETIKRKRKHGIFETAKEIPFKYFIFDILFKDGQNLIKEPFSKRREILEKAIKERSRILQVSPQILTKDPEVLRKYYDKQIASGLEGVVAKKWQSPYEPGRRGFKWVKLKQEETKKGGGLADTIDCVVMGVTRGRGKRADFGVGSFLVGVRSNDKFVTVTNIGTGLSDEQFRELNTRSRKLKVKEMPKEYVVHKNQEPDTWIEPKIVVEIQADNITKSPIHTAGLSLRFPRLINFRDDKSPEEITTVKEVESLAEMQFGK